MDEPSKFKIGNKLYTFIHVPRPKHDYFAYVVEGDVMGINPDFDHPVGFTIGSESKAEFSRMCVLIAAAIDQLPGATNWVILGMATQFRRELGNDTKLLDAILRI